MGTLKRDVHRRLMVSSVGAALLAGLLIAPAVRAATPFVRWLAFATGAITAVRDRDIHTHPIPRRGGVAMLLGCGAASGTPKVGS